MSNVVTANVIERYNTIVMKKRRKEDTHRIMTSIHSKNTIPEVQLRKDLWKNGIRYRIHSVITGKPDICIKKYKLAIFVDGDFWHGNNWRLRGYDSLEEELARYKKYWREKIQRNVNRDKEVNQKLKSEGWIVLRFWESEIKIDVLKCTKRIIKRRNAIIIRKKKI